ncbi:MAG: hypothetical protein EAY76_04570 [Alphaproteobacteria bacterium]|nr:MAG: hypothetical protein EAY76_04570 [Alphaproteobacteria bacterium]TAF39921.1 MAG: hypothetical protein EAZ66_03965 [Alphaproteobacteria bacterium]TAF77471.1 MAG: hypothetical protein EAZ52_00455 [Alphaproteobacteria bacterium]
MTTNDAPKTKEELTKQLRMLTWALYFVMFTVTGIAAYFYFVFEDDTVAMALLLQVVIEYMVLRHITKTTQEKIALAPSSPSPSSSHTTPQTQSY